MDPASPESAALPADGARITYAGLPFGTLPRTLAPMTSSPPSGSSPQPVVREPARERLAKETLRDQHGWTEDQIMALTRGSDSPAEMQRWLLAAIQVSEYLGDTAAAAAWMILLAGVGHPGDPLTAVRCYLAAAAEDQQFALLLPRAGLDTNEALRMRADGSLTRPAVETLVALRQPVSP